MAKKAHVCSVPGCSRHIYNLKRELCQRCAGSFYYWSNKPGGMDKNVALRKQNLKFWSSRLDWFVEDTKER